MDDGCETMDKLSLRLRQLIIVNDASLQERQLQI
jgi:hypothetical protein